MTNALRDRYRLRLGVFLGANLVACLVVINLLVLPVRGLLGERDGRIVDEGQMLARLTAVAAQAQTVQGLLEATETAKNGPEFLRGANSGVIAADLQTRLTGMVQGAGGRVRSIRTLSPKTIDKVHFIGAQVEMSGPIRAVYQFVYSVETTAPYLFIAGAAIKPSAQVNFQGGAGINATEPLLDAQLDIIGALEPGERD